MEGDPGRPAASAATVSVPVRLRLFGRPTDADLALLEETISHAVARRLSLARRTLGGAIPASSQSAFGRRPAVKRSRRRPAHVGPEPRPKPDPRDVQEFALLSGKKNQKLADSPGNPLTNLSAYLRQRRRIFPDSRKHPDDAYRAFATDSDAEIAANPGLLKVLEYYPNAKAQTAFYHWVRKAYFSQGITEDVPGYILRADRRASELRGLVRKDAAAAYGKKQWTAMATDFRIEGFNPRPIKSAAFRYQLGTLSEHATGAAVDVDPGHNAVLSLAQWRWIETVAGQSVDRDLQRWHTDPKSLWQAIHDLNEAFVHEIAEGIRQEEARQIMEHLPSRFHFVEPDSGESDWATRHKQLRLGVGVPRGRGLKRAKPIDVVFASQLELRKYRMGFFALDWALVERLHRHDLIWGATYSTKVDLHHFELPHETVAEDEARARRVRELVKRFKWVPDLRRPTLPDQSMFRLPRLSEPPESSH